MSTCVPSHDSCRAAWPYLLAVTTAISDLEIVQGLCYSRIISIQVRTVCPYLNADWIFEAERNRDRGCLRLNFASSV